MNSLKKSKSTKSLKQGCKNNHKLNWKEWPYNIMQIKLK